MNPKIIALYLSQFLRPTYMLFCNSFFSSKRITTKFVYLKYDIKYFIRNSRYFGKFGLKRAKRRNVLYFIFEPNGKHPGLADRIKAIIALYNVTKRNGYDFKFYFKTPFLLSDYLHPRTDSQAELNELEYSIQDTRFVNEKSWRPIKRLIPNKQYHCYCYAGNDIPWQFADSGYRWTDLFHELFEASELLQRAYDELNMPNAPYVSVQLRFVNALERFEDTFFDNYIEDPKRRKELVKKCKRCIKAICEENEGRIVYVFSDSKLFLDQLSDLPVRTLPADNIGHSGDNHNADVQLKTFLDLYVMSRSVAIYRLRGEEIYNLSCFALLAARIGDVPFIDREIDKI